MNTRDNDIFAFRLLRTACVIGFTLAPVPGSAQVSEADFKDLKEAVQKLTQKVEGLEQIKQLRERLGETQTAAADAARKAEAATQAQPVYRVPDDSGSVNKNFLIL